MAGNVLNVDIFIDRFYMKASDVRANYVLMERDHERFKL